MKIFSALSPSPHFHYADYISACVLLLLLLRKEIFVIEGISERETALEERWR
jgi:hypothetical protein